MYLSSTRVTRRPARGHGDAGTARPETTRRRTTRSLAGVLATVTAFGTTVLFAPSASASLASLASFGPVDPATEFPSSYTDSSGLALELCLGLPRCLADTDLVQIHEDGGDAEAFYYAADATAGPFELHDALEAAYAAEGPHQEIVFQRTQVRAKDAGLPSDTDYTVTDPYGTFTCTTNEDGEIDSNGCRIETTPVEGEFGRALNGRIGPFLTWDTSVGVPPEGYIGDNATPHKVVGSPTGFNAFRVEGPGLTGTCAGGTIDDCVETGLFIVQGKVQAGGASASVSTGTLDFGDVASPVTKTLTYANTGSVPITIDPVAVSGDAAAAFEAGSDCPAAPDTLDVGGRCTIDVTFTPQPGTSSAATLTITDDTPAATRAIALKGSNLPTIVVVDPAPPRALTFGNQAVNSSSPENNVVIGNTGTGPLTVASASLTGASAAHYKLETNGCTRQVAPDGGCEIAVVFAPTTTGSKTANLRVTEANGAIVDVPLTGTAVSPLAAPGQPTIGTPTAGDALATVRWTAPTSNGGSAITGYEVRTYAGATGTAVLSRTPTGASTTSVVVPNLTNGTAYTFRVVAINAAGTSVESARSAAVTPVSANPAPTVTGRTPAAGAASVGVADNITATFSEAVQGVTGTTFQVRTGTATGAVGSGTVSYDAATRVATLNPTANLANDTTYTVTLSGGATAIRDTANAPLANVSWSFRTGPVPTVTARTPGVGATGVSAAGNVTATFSEPVTGVSGSTVALRTAAGAPVPAAVTYNATTRVVTLNPNATLPGDTRFTVTLTGGDPAIRDTAGNPLVTTTWSFLTGAAPTITARSPLANATGVSRTANMSATFSEAVAGVSGTTVRLTNATTGAVIASAVTYNATTRVATLNPNTTLTASTRYTVTVTGGTGAVRDTAGNPFATSSWSFTTGT